jgi:hypothetical protein
MMNVAEINDGRYTNHGLKLTFGMFKKSHFCA